MLFYSVAGILLYCYYTLGDFPHYKVSEGQFAYPKLITTISFPEEAVTSCTLDTVNFPDRVRTAIRPLLFGVRIPQITPQRHQRHNDHIIRSVRSVSNATESVTAKYLDTTSRHVVTSSPNISSTPAYTTAQRTEITTFIPSAVNSPSIIIHTTGKPAPIVTVHIVQLYDLDRETQDQYLLTLHCVNRSGVEVEFPRLLIIDVTDINDNTPKFITSSLSSVVSTKVDVFDAVMDVKATDADIGINAAMRFSSIAGTERWKFPNSTSPVHATSACIAMLSSGQVVLLNRLTRDMVITFKVVVKDMGSRPNGNRATATATVSVYSKLPVTTTSQPSLPSTEPAAISLKTWEIVAISVGVGVCVLSAVAIFLIRLKRKRRIPQLTLSTREDVGGNVLLLAEILVDSELSFIS
uniref:protocadherin-1 isoform X1 n=1 Tax=Ciona intestinalis TaxID=7719 RepID=UPI00089DB0A7|nr:protocadherin-1 isoform X1 [Ciona intestinalis]|eukprot:XP_026692121.1 protocadherin-1 isoform X1 [Ciona intestinalis]